MTFTTQIDSIASSLRTWLEEEYGSRLKGIYIFGSHARQSASPDSDVDIAVVLDVVESRFLERQRCSEFVSDLSLENDVVINLVFLGEEEFKSQRYALFRNIRNEGTPV